MRKVTYVLYALGAIIVLAGIFMFAGMGTVKNLRVGDVDLSRVADGTYQGQYKHARWNPQCDCKEPQDHRSNMQRVGGKSADEQGYGRSAGSSLREHQS